MKRHHDLRSKQTLDVLEQLKQDGAKKIGLLIRHSARFFTQEARMEPFMGLTPEGKNFAHELGQALPSDPTPVLYSSFFGRCIETAYLIDKGYTRANQNSPGHTITDPTLAPFYIKDIEKAIHLVEAQGTDLFLRNWFDKKIEETIMENPERSCDRLCEFMVEKLMKTDPESLTICISHDWNIYPIKEFKMGLSHEMSGDVGYLDGLAFFEKENTYYLTNFQSKPICL